MTSPILSLTERLLNSTPVSADPIQGCCGLVLTACRCNQIVCSRCEITKAENEFIPQECLTLEAVSGGPVGFYPVTHAGHLWVDIADEAKAYDDASHGDEFQLPPTPRATDIVPHQIICSNMMCGFCRRMLWDCRCPVDVECSCCELSPEDADAVGTDCEHSPDGMHVWVARSE